VRVTSDAELVRIAFGPGRPPVHLRGGDLARTLGVADVSAEGDRDMVLEFPIDVVDIATDLGDFVACAHVVACRPALRGGRWFGPVVAVMNAEFIGSWDVAPRGHPNDGRAEIIEVDERFSRRDRLVARRRLPLGTHVPHPAIITRSVREATFEFASPMVLRVDGVKVGRCRSLGVRVRPDAAVVYS
jgi:YegS C-terminal NAD kinase beta sandwich-like domain